MSSQAEGHNQGVSYEADIYGDFILFPGAEQLTYQEIFERYALSSYGLHHATQPPRYHQQYAYDFTQMIDDLGDDVHPVRHMSHTEQNLVRPFLEAQNQSASAGHEPFSPNEVAAMRTGALLHDIGECEAPAIEQQLGYTVGDVWWEAKADADHDREAPVRQILYQELFADVPPELLTEAETVIVKADGNRLGEAFNVVERIGYFKTGMRAGELAIRLARAEEDRLSQRLVQLSRLAIRVSSNHYGFIESKQGLYPFAGKVLARHGRLHELINTKLQHVSENGPSETA